MEKFMTAMAVLMVSVLILAFFAVVLALPTQILWNSVMPDVTKGAVTSLSFWQALGLNFLCVILFKRSCDCNKERE